MEELFISAFGMSIAFAAQPGVITFEAIRRGVQRGWRAALQIEFGSLVGDATWALMAWIGVSVLFQNKLISLVLSMLGCYLLLRFAWEAWKTSHETFTISTPQANIRGDFATGAALSLSNPQNLTFWLGMSGTVIGLGFLNPEPMHLLVFFTGFMFAQVCWCFFVAGLIGYSRQFMTPRLYRWLNIASAVILAYFGGATCYGTLLLLAR